MRETRKSVGAARNVDDMAKKRAEGRQVAFLPVGTRTSTDDAEGAEDATGRTSPALAQKSRKANADSKLVRLRRFLGEKLGRGLLYTMDAARRLRSLRVGRRRAFSGGQRHVDQFDVDEWNLAWESDEQLDGHGQPDVGEQRNERVHLS